jgi:DNA polymerase III subunit epsilon
MSPWWRRRVPPVDEGRWAVLDVESSGLDARRDRLVAIAAIAVRADWPRRRLDIDIGDSFEVVLRQEQATAHDNILLHGIGAQRQRGGVLPRQALEAFDAWVGRSPLLAFHAAFDQALIGRARAAAGMPPLENPWADIEHLCAVTHQGVKARSLDEWMAHFGIVCARRHEAAADTLAECELLLRVWPRAARECSDWRGVAALAARQRWTARR